MNVSTNAILEPFVNILIDEQIQGEEPDHENIPVEISMKYAPANLPTLTDVEEQRMYIEAKAEKVHQELYTLQSRNLQATDPARIFKETVEKESALEKRLLSFAKCMEELEDREEVLRGGEQLKKGRGMKSILSLPTYHATCDKEKEAAFMRHFINFIKVNGICHTHWVAILSQALGGAEASSMAEQLCSDESFKTLEAMQAWFLKTFESDNVQSKARQSLQDLYQGEKPLREYTVTFLELVKITKKDREAEETLLQYIEGMAPDITGVLMSRQQDFEEMNFDDLREAALKIKQTITIRDRKRKHFREEQIQSFKNRQFTEQTNKDLSPTKIAEEQS